MTEDNINNKFSFPQFDVVSDFSDHLFLSCNSKPLKPNGSCFKAISKEWRILQESLPESIFVRVSETRFDLLRAAIIGVVGTPYHDGVFIFDIALTSNYPKSPPKVRYHSQGYQINPIISRHGNICLSLLSTWMGLGRRSEKWNPKQSTLLQVLLSLQSLVLKESPYDDYWIKKLSEYCSQRIFLYTCCSAIKLIRNPPTNFESLIHHHFRDRANVILAACEAYVNGRVTIGLYGCDRPDPPGFEIQSRFQKDMERVYGLLVVEFRRINANIPVAAERLVVIQNSDKSNKMKGILKRLGKIKDFLGQ